MRRLLNRLLGRSMVEEASAGKPPLAASQAEAEYLIAEGNVLEDASQWVEAETRYRNALTLYPGFARAYLNLGNVQAAQGQFKEAAASYREALRLESGYGAAHANLGKLYLAQKNYQNAAEHYAAAVRELPGSVDAWVGLGSALEETGCQTEATEAYQKALAIQPGFTGAKLNLGQLLLKLKRFDEAAEYLQDVLSATPERGLLIHALLGQAMINMGMINDALKHYGHASQLEPRAPELVRIPALFMNCFPDYTPEKIFAAHLDYAQRFCSKFYPQNPSYSNVPDPGRMLRVCYVSGDFRKHAVSRFIEPVLIHHGRDRFEVHCFYNHHHSDGITERLKGFADVWHPVAEMDDHAAAKLVRDLGIDILVDLSGYTEGHRLPLFARKPAPVQATWLGYLSTTGLATMDYRICDAYTDPPGLTERFHTETLARLPDSQWCHISYEALESVADLPADLALADKMPSPLLKNGYLTLGSFNHSAKLNDQVLALWAEVLNTVPDAHLHIAAIPSGRAQERIISVMKQSGVDCERIEFIPPLAFDKYLACIAQVDLVLDPFPYNGGTTSIDALIMGVPLVTLAGDRSIARGGVSLLSNLGRVELIAATPQEYIGIVQQLANEPLRLAALRQGLRQQLAHSPLMDGARFTRNLEALYRQMWQTWCDSQQQNPVVA
ncbi:MAG TPA: tetratricopeptide repeat protein [Candidatus Competibacteraceae bacterium]|nr:tetratricopeptide repeat protein [Candidatus Competibacteraceae bacterium]MCP5132587.1 tetratricopeptide repeat protein [Gammaproteobacteria bacterium]HPF57642.1 tetratricopeptide repeat protein [Candidatus Competibacteraceae bacterium]